MFGIRQLCKYTGKYAKLCDLTNFESSNDQLIRIDQVLNRDQIEHFTKVLETYDATARSFYEKLIKPLLNQQEKLFVGYENYISGVIAILFTSPIITVNKKFHIL